MILQNVDFIISLSCKDHSYWCYKSGLRLKYSDPASSILNESDYKVCVHYCQDSATCGGFEYEAHQKKCRFAMKLSGNIQQLNTGRWEVYWKKSDNISCSQPIYDGNYKTT